MPNGHGGVRTGAGRKKKALSDKLIKGNRGYETLSKIQLPPLDASDINGEDMPPPSE